MRDKLFFFFVLVVFQGVNGHLADNPSWHRPLLLIGAPKSGLEETAHLLRDVGLEIPGKCVGKHGAISWLLTFDPPPGKKGPFSDRLTFDHIFHQVRNPLNVIASLIYEDDSEVVRKKNVILEAIPEISIYDSPFVKRVKIWYYFTLQGAEKAEWTFRFEDREEALQEIEHRLGVSLDMSALNDKKSGQLPKKITWETLEKKLNSFGEQELFNKVRELGRFYGYD